MAEFLVQESNRLGINNVSGLVRMLVAEYMDKKTTLTPNKK